MKILDDVKAIFEHHELKKLELPDGYDNVYSYLKTYPDRRCEFVPKINDSQLYLKYQKNISSGWYGFDVGTPIIPEWMEIIDSILELCIKVDPNFKIHQIKLKYGGIRFYVHTEIIEDVCDVECLIESKLYNDALIY